LHGTAKIVAERKPLERATPSLQTRAGHPWGQAFCFLAPTTLSFSLLGRIRLAGIECVCGANAFVMIGSRVGEQDRVISRGLTGQSHIVTHASRSPNLACTPASCFTVRHGSLMAASPSFHSACWDHFSLCRLSFPFVHAIHVTCIFCFAI
jgi:hypothetical protein